MNYLQLCQAVRSRIGLHGTGPSSVTAATDVEKDIVDAVYDAWVDIQNFRTEWKWMRGEESFSTSIGEKEYTTIDVGGPTNRIRVFVRDTLWIHTGTVYYRPTFVDYEFFEDLYKNDHDTTQPGFYTFNPYNDALHIQSPDAVYSCTIEYWKTPQMLTENTSIPEVDMQHHNLIIYLAIQKLSASIASASSAYEASQSYAVGMGQLMRDQLVKKKMNAKGIA